MRILSRHFVSGYLTFYAGIIVVSLLVIAIIEMMVNLDDAIEYGDGVAGVASYLFLRLPSYYLPLLVPVGSFGASFLCLGIAARSLEVLASKASGISPRRLVAPVLVTAGVLSLLALVLNETIVLNTAKRINRGSDSEDVLFQARGSFWFHRGDTMISIQEADRETRRLRGVAIYERDRQGRLRRSVHADSARIGPDHRWELEGAVFREFPAEPPDAAPRTEAHASTWLEVGDADELALLDADPRSLSLPRLGAYIDAREREGRGTARFRAMWHARLADPASVLLFALLGAPLGMAVERSRSIARSALEGVALLGAYYGLQSTVAVLGSGGVAAAVFAPWVVLGIFAAFGAWRLGRVSA